MKRIRLSEALLNIAKQRKLLIRCCALIVIPFVLGAFLLIVTNNAIGDLTESNATAKIEHFKSMTNSLLEDIQRVADSIKTDTVVQKSLTNGGNFNPYQISSILSNYARGNSNIEHIFFVNIPNQSIINENGNFSLESGDALFKSIDPNLSDDVASIPEGWNIVNKDYASPYYIAHLSSQDGDEHPSTIVISLKPITLLNILRAVDVDFCCVFNEKCAISPLFLAHQTPDWYNEKEVSRLVGEPVHCVYASGDGFSYLVAIAVQDYYRPLHIILWTFAFYFLGVLIYIIFSAVWFFEHRYDSISGIMNMLMADLPSSGSYEDALRKVHAHLQYYKDNSKPLDEMYREQCMRNLLTIEHAVVTESNLQAAGIANVGCFYVATLFINDYGSFLDIENLSDHTQIFDVMIHSVFSHFKTENMKIASVDIYPNYTAVFSLPNSDNSAHQVRQTLSSVMDFLSGNFNMQMQGIVSAPFSNISCFSKAYRVTCESHSLMSIIGNDTPILMQDDLTYFTELPQSGDYIKDLRILINTLLAEKYEILPAMVDTMLQRFVVPYSENNSLCRQRNRTIATILAETLRDLETDYTNRSGSIKRLLASYSSTEELSTTVREIFTELSNIKKDTIQGSPLIRATAYIQENLSDPSMSVHSICEEIGISIPYLSRLFKQKMNVTPNEYINTQRIDKAKKLLTSSKLTISQICTEVGYISMDTFGRNFRCREGVSMSEYRKTNTSR